MKKVIFLLPFVILGSLGCSHKPLIKSLSEGDKLKAVAKRYEGKPLKYLLRDIAPPIVLFTGDEKFGDHGRFPSFYFRFYNLSSDCLAKMPGLKTILVYVTDSFELSNFRERYLAQQLSWTEADTKLYGHLKVNAIRVWSN